MALRFQHLGDNDTIAGLSELGIPYLSISVSLNILLTLMIVIRLVLHGRNIRTAPRSAVGIIGLCKMASTMLIESCAIFTVSSFVVVGALAAARAYNPGVHYPGSFTADIFFPILAEIQVRAFP